MTARNENEQKVERAKEADRQVKSRVIKKLRGTPGWKGASQIDQQAMEARVIREEDSFVWISNPILL